MKENYHRHIISHKLTVLDALKQINHLSGKDMTLFVTNDDGVLLGTLTDGDIRRNLIAGSQLTDSVESIAHRKFASFLIGQINVKQLRALRSRRITMVPCLDAEGRIADIINLNEQRSLLPLDAVLMAGGKGERLRPLTLSTPKPLLQIGGKCIIDYNVEALIRHGVKHISATLNYLAEQIEEHFKEPMVGVKVQCVREPKRMGTIGSLTLIPEFHNDYILLMNSDLLTSIDYEALFCAHINEHADVTVATIPYKVSVPYGIFTLDGNRITGLEEKPTYNHYANAGIYIISRQCISMIPRDTYVDATDFLEMLIAAGKKVCHYPINGTWIDIGSPNDFRQAEELMARRDDLNGI